MTAFHTGDSCRHRNPKPAGSLGMVGVEKASPGLEAMAPRETPGRPAAPPEQMTLGGDRVARVKTERKDAA